MQAAYTYFFSLCTFIIISARFSSVHAQKKEGTKKQPVAFAIPVQIRQELEIFNNWVTDAEYFISLCADVPNNKKPHKVYYQKETGHVFLILTKIVLEDTLYKVFGFYPAKGLPTVFKRRVKSIIKDNSSREYDVQIFKSLTAQQFEIVLQYAVHYSNKAYHLNKYNCYDYAVLIYNSITGNEPLPFITARYPFIFGRGGSPVSIYKQLKEMQSLGVKGIEYGELLAPVSTKNKTQQIVTNK